MFKLVAATGGTVVRTGGTVVRTNGTVVRTGGTVVRTDGTVVRTGGTVVRTGGSVVRTGGTVVRTRPEGCCRSRPWLLVNRHKFCKILFQLQSSVACYNEHSLAAAPLDRAGFTQYTRLPVHP